MKHWYSFKSKDGSIRGYALEKGKAVKQSDLQMRMEFTECQETK